MVALKLAPLTIFFGNQRQRLQAELEIKQSAPRRFRLIEDLEGEAFGDNMTEPNWRTCRSRSNLEQVHANWLCQNIQLQERAIPARRSGAQRSARPAEPCFFARHT
jgi:hypothetical protein